MNGHRITLLALLALIVPASAGAYEAQRSQTNSIELKWKQLPMRFNISGAAAPGVSASQTQAAVRAAYQAWAAVSCSNFNTQDLGQTNNQYGDRNDGVSTNTWLPGWPAEYGAQALGITLTRYNPQNGAITDADTHYNPNYKWAVSGSMSAIDVQSVATHEIGHQLGLDHSAINSATMFYATGQGDTSQRSLHSDDIAGICHIYPSGGTAPPECTPQGGCAPNETCQNGTCVSAGNKGYGGPCAGAQDCDSGMCLQSAGSTFCSQSCVNDPCPNNDQCVTVSTGMGGTTNACLPNSGQQATQGLGGPCQSNLDCKSDICVSVPGTGYLCSQSCASGGSDCPTGYVCAQSNAGGVCVPDPTGPPPPPPPPKDKKNLGNSCGDHAECKSGICGQTGNGMVCIQLCDGKAPCPDGFDCLPVTNSDKGACVAPLAPKPGTLGSECTDHAQCDSKICAQNSDGSRFCTVTCQPTDGCPGAFECVSAGANKHVCKAKQPDKDSGFDGGGSGCAVAGSGPPSLLLLLLGLALVGRRRRRHR